MSASAHLRPFGVSPSPPTLPPHRMAGAVMVVIASILLLAACGETTAKPTADDAATIAAASTTTGTAGTARTPGASTGTAGASSGTAAVAVGAARSFGGLLTPVRSTATRASTGTSVRGTGTVSGTAVRVTGTASGTGSASRAAGTPSGPVSAASPALDPCALLTPAEVSKAMTEPFSQFDNQDESPAGMTSKFRGYSSASCTFAATGSTQDSVRAVQLGTIRRTPASPPPTGSGTLGTINDVWSYIKQQESTANPSTLMGVGDEAFALSDPDNPGDEDVFVRKGEIVLLVVVTGYDMGARDKAVAVAMQAANKL